MPPFLFRYQIIWQFLVKRELFFVFSEVYKHLVFFFGIGVISIQPDSSSIPESPVFQRKDDAIHDGRINLIQPFPVNTILALSISDSPEPSCMIPKFEATGIFIIEQAVIERSRHWTIPMIQFHLGLRKQNRKITSFWLMKDTIHVCLFNQEIVNKKLSANIDRLDLRRILQIRNRKRFQHRFSVISNQPFFIEFYSIVEYFHMDSFTNSYEQ